MTTDEIVALLKTASAYDNRKPDYASVLAWAESAKRGRWTFDRAVDAIHHHYATSTDRIMPAHITAHHRAQALRPMDQSVVEALGAPVVPASDERRAELMAQVRRIAELKRVPDA